MLATKLPTSAEMALYQWSRKGAPAPKLAAPITVSGTTLSFTAPFKDENDVVVAAGFPLGIRKATGWTEQCWVPARTVDGGGAVLTGLSLDGLTAYGVVRGVDPGSYDYTSGSANFADSHDGDEPVFCNIPAFIPELIRSVLQGLIASGGTSFILGVDASGTVTIKRSTGAGTNAGFLRWDSVTTKAQFTNDGVLWINIDDTVASVLFKVSATDTTPSYAEQKFVAGSNIVITKKNSGANEYLEISTALPTTIVSPSTYTSAYLTGDNTAESNYLLWGALTNGSFAITIDGVLRTVSGINTVGTTSMANIATVIQTAIRALTTKLETVTWSTDHFIISSVDTTSTSAITVTSATGSGTDISGAGTFGGLGCDTGHGIVTNAVLNQAVDSGKLPALDTNGRINNSLVNGQTLPAQIYAADSEVSDSYVITLSPTPVAYYIGMIVNFKANTSNKGTCTLNINGLGAKTIKKRYNLDLEDNDIVANEINSVIYDGTNFQLLSGITKQKKYSSAGTLFETPARFIQSSSTGTATFGNNGLDLSGGTNTLNYIKVNLTSPINQNVTSNTDYYCSITAPYPMTSGELFLGIGDVAISNGVHTYINNHIGFKMTSSGLYATCANGTTETATLMTASYTTITGVRIECRNGYVNFYYRNSSGWSAATVISTNIPASLASTCQWSAASNGTGSAYMKAISMKISD